MTQEQLSQIANEHGGKIAALEEKAKSAHKRHDENDKITNGIHELAANMRNLTEQVKALADRLETGLREQGKRIGGIETAFIKITNLEADVKSAIARIDRIEKTPGDRWNNLVQQIIGLVVAAVVGGVIAYINK